MTKLQVGDTVTLFGNQGFSRRDVPYKITKVKRILKYKIELEDGSTLKVRDGEITSMGSIQLTVDAHRLEIKRLNLLTKVENRLLRHDIFQSMSFDDLSVILDLLIKYQKDEK